MTFIDIRSLEESRASDLMSMMQALYHAAAAVPTEWPPSAPYGADAAADAIIY